VKQFASEDATVVVGTGHRSGAVGRDSCDGGGDGSRPAGCEPASAHAHARREQHQAHSHHTGREMPGREAAPSMRVVRRQPLSSSDYAALDKPTVQRQRAVGDGLRPDADTEDLLDIPAFLRRQAD